MFEPERTLFAEARSALDELLAAHDDMIRTAEALAKATEESERNSVAISPDGALLATAGWDDKAVHLCDPITGREIRRLQSAADAASAHGLFEGVAAPPLLPMAGR